jgi:RND family efflux transporter MFP subunit
LESIKVDLENTSIKAPFNGEVETIMIEEGEMVSIGMPVIRLIGTDTYKITAGVPARYSEAVKLADKVDIWFDTQVRDTLHTAINYVGGSINPQNRTFRIETKLPVGKNYKVDMIANLRLKTYEREDVLVVSEEYVYSKNDKYVVYILSENAEGKAIAKEQEVQLGLSYQTDVIIENGLSVRDRLITLGSAFLDDGMRVTVKDDKNLASN